MIYKLTRYDLAERWKELRYFVLLALITPILARLFMSLGDVWIYHFMAGFFSGVWIGMLVACLVTFIAGAFRSFARFLYHDESYLIHTLPVKKSDLYLSRVLTSFLNLIAITIVALLSLFLRFGGDPSAEMVIDFARDYLALSGLSLFEAAFIFITVFDLEMMAIILVGYLAIVIGYRFQQHKIGISVALGFAGYLLEELLLLLALRIWGIFNPDIMLIFSESSMQVPGVGGINLPLRVDIVAQVGWFAIVFFIAICLITWAAGLYVFKRGVNVD